MLYFAYGSNLNHFQMKRRCKDSKFIKKINLKGYTLNFRSKYRAADIEKKNNLVVAINPKLRFYSVKLNPVSLRGGTHGIKF